MRYVVNTISHAVTGMLFYPPASLILKKKKIKEYL
jgi:hypothetical protein